VVRIQLRKIMFEQALEFTIKWEVAPSFLVDEDVRLGRIDTPLQRKKVGYTNDPHDRGGATKFGVAQASHPSIKVEELTWEQAKDIYLKEYWLPAGCDKLPEKVSLLHFDAAVNVGVKRAVQFLQRAAGVTDDGIMGPATTTAAATVQVKSAIEERRRYYRYLVLQKPLQGRYLQGWLNRCADLERVCT
jgi:lysozyme family protein